MTDFDMDDLFGEEDPKSDEPEEVKEVEVEVKESKPEGEPEKEEEKEEQHASSVQEIDLASVPVAKRAEMAKFAENMGMKIKNEHLLNTAKAPKKQATEAIQMSLEGINDEELEKIEHKFRISGRNLARSDILFDGFPCGPQVCDEIEEQLFKLKDSKGEPIYNKQDSHIYIYILCALGIPKSPGKAMAEQYKYSPLTPHHFNRIINGDYRREIGVRVFFNELDSKADVIWFKEYLVSSPEELESVEKLARTEAGWLGSCECEIKFDYPGSNGNWNKLLTLNADVANYEHERKRALEEKEVANSA